MRIRFILPALLLITNLSIAQWIQQSSGNNSTLFGVHFFDSNVGWVAGGGGIMLRTNDGGDNWINQATPTTSQLRATHFIDQNIGWAVGDEGAIIKTSDGGLNWFTQNSNTVYFLISVHFLNPDVGWVVGFESYYLNSRIILKTTDGGDNWIIFYQGYGKIFRDIYFTDLNTGWIVGTEGYITKTTNGGGNWINQSQAILKDFQSVYFVNPNIGWAVGDFGLIMKTTNGGTNWIDQSSGNVRFMSVYFLNNQTGWIVGESYFSGYDAIILKTSNGGTDWIPQPSGTGSDLESVFFTDLGTGWAVGTNGTILKYEDIPQPPDLSIEIKYPYFTPNFFYSRSSLYDQNKFLVEIGLTTQNIIDPPIYNIKLEVFLDGNPLDLILNSDIYTLDNNNDGLIDVFPTSISNYAIRLIAISPELFQYNFEDKILNVAITEIDGNPVTIESNSSVSMYFINHPNLNRAYSNMIDSYSFENPEGLTFAEYIYYMTAQGINFGLLTSLFYTLTGQNGRCFGMAATAGQYFVLPNTKPLPNTVFSWNPPAPIVLDNINKSHILQGFYIKSRSYNNLNQYNELRLNILDNKPALIGMREEVTNDGHAVLGTKITSFDGQISYVHIYDSNSPSEDRAAKIDINNFNFNYSYFNEFTIFSPSLYTLTSFQTAFTNYIENLVSNFGNFKIFGIACPVNVYVENTLGQKVGLLSTGEYVNEIPNSSILRAPTGNNTGDSLTILIVPDNYEYIAKATSFGTGNFNFERVEKISTHELNVDYISDVQVENNNVLLFDETNPTLLGIDFDGDGTIDTIFNVNNQTITGIESNPTKTNKIPLQYSLLQNYPNPFNPLTSISYLLPVAGIVVLKIYDVLGKEIETLVHEEKVAGSYEVEFNASNLPSGVYFYRLQAGDFVQTKKMILLK